MMRRLRSLLFLGVATLLATLNWYCGSGGSEKAEIRTERKTYAALTEDARYVGMQTCSGCHADVHATFIHTGMGKSFDLAGKKKSSGNFSGHPVVSDISHNLSYHPYWNQEELRLLEFRLEGRDTIFKRDVPISYIVGSGQHTNSHMWVSNEYYFQAPVTFYTQKQKWDLPPGFENGENSRFSRLIGLECMTCHNGYPEFVIGSENKYSKVKNGIDCERCHGPGSIHVEEKSKGILIDTSKYIDYSIVNPSKLPIDLQFDVCQRCHIQGNSVMKEGKSYFDFIPGMRLSEVMDVYMPVYENNESVHIMASHAERLKMSKCFQVTDARIKGMTPSVAGLKPYKNGLTCITCHNPHVSVKNSIGEQFNNACNGCHGDSKEQTCTNDPLKNKINGNNCVSCHMPSNSTTDIPHVSVHDHRIAVHVKSTIPAVQKLKGINAINNPNPSRESVAQAYINYVEKFGMDISLLDSALKYLSVTSDKERVRSIHPLIQIAYLKKDLATITRLSELPGVRDLLSKKSYDNKDAWTSYRIGEAYNFSGKQSQAIYWFGKSVELAPYNAEFANKYGTALAASGDLAKAEMIFRDLIREHPEYAPGYNNLGYLLLTRDRNIAAAKELFNKSLSLDPDYEKATLNMAMIMMLEGRKSDAEKVLKRLMKTNPQNSEARMALQQILKR
jgi:predicted CXXCH cytochrome family protein